MFEYKDYRPINRGNVPAVKIDKNNIAEIEAFLNGYKLEIGEYFIAPDERDDTNKLKFRRACIWSKEKFESMFEEDM